MEKSSLGESAELYHDLAEGKVRTFVTNHLVQWGYSYNQDKPGEYSVPLKDGCLGFRFVPIREDGGEGICEVRWTYKKADGMAIPPWEFRWKDGQIDEHDSTRFFNLLQWVHQINGKSLTQFPVYSRCREEDIGFPLLNGGERIVPVREIICLQAERDWTRLTYGHGLHKESVLLDRSISKCEHDLRPFGFMRIHRSYVVNLGCIRGYLDSGLKNRVELCDGSVLPVARRRCSELRTHLATIRSRHDHLSENSEEVDNT